MCEARCRLSERHAISEATGGFDMHKHLMMALSTAALLTTTAVFAQAPQAPNLGNLEKLGAFKTTGASPNIPTIPQTGPKADAIKKHLQSIKLPHGFHIGLYALVPDARHMTVGPQGIVTFVGTRKSQIYAVTDRGKTGVAEEVKQIGRASCRERG